MTSETPGDAPDQSDMRRTQDELLLQAVAVLRRRCAEGGRYSDLPPAAASELGDRLAGLTSDQQEHQQGPGVDRAEALALAHRLLDDDHPELSPLWPGAVE